MTVQAVSHIAVGVRDMEAALGFYRDIVGLRVTADKIEEFPQGPGLPPAQRRAVYLRWVDGPHASFIVLDQQITNEIKGEPAQLFQMGCHHFAFWVDDIDDVFGARSVPPASPSSWAARVRAPTRSCTASLREVLCAASSCATPRGTTCSSTSARSLTAWTRRSIT